MNGCCAWQKQMALQLIGGKKWCCFLKRNIRFFVAGNLEKMEKNSRSLEEAPSVFLDQHMPEIQALKMNILSLGPCRGPCVWGEKGAFSFWNLNWGLTSETQCWQKRTMSSPVIIWKTSCYLSGIWFTAWRNTIPQEQWARAVHFFPWSKGLQQICLMPFFPIYFYLIFSNQNNLRVLKINNSAIHYCASHLIFLVSCQLINREGMLLNSVIFFITWYWHTGYCFMI